MRTGPVTAGTPDPKATDRRELLLQGVELGTLNRTRKQFCNLCHCGTFEGGAIPVAQDCGRIVHGLGETQDLRTGIG